MEGGWSEESEYEILIEEGKELGLSEEVEMLEDMYNKLSKSREAIKKAADEGRPMCGTDMMSFMHQYRNMVTEMYDKVRFEREYLTFPEAARNLGMDKEAETLESCYTQIKEKKGDYSMAIQDFDETVVKIKLKIAQGQR